MAEVRWLDAGEARIWQLYRDVQRELNSALERRLTATSGLSGADYAVLVALSEADCGLRTRDLGRILGWERSRLSHQVSRMEKRGQVARFECDTDARGSMVKLTPTGKAAIEAAAPDHVEAVRTFVFDRLHPNELKAFEAVLQRILTGLPSTKP
ncbi:MarR family winged helix-turn-helix transcriptional regulator [Kribbella deserti]|uniref:MarR family winged helix-turn-helix transcriptional regulator n=1 Tax=Kribbella deserti TaxID=1926257 RepID=A0ABV6QVT3_9ACTN